MRLSQPHDSCKPRAAREPESRIGFHRYGGAARLKSSFAAKTAACRLHLEWSPIDSLQRLLAQRDSETLLVRESPLQRYARLTIAQMGNTGEGCSCTLRARMQLPVCPE